MKTWILSQSFDEGEEKSRLVPENRKARDKDQAHATELTDKQVTFKLEVKTFERVYQLRTKKRFTGETWLFMLYG